MRTKHRAAAVAEGEAPSRAEKNARLAKIEAAAGSFKAWRPASTALRKVRAVPTIFPQFDHKTRVGGLPIERFMLVHGPSGHGKTKFTLGLIASFLKLDNYAELIDAERTTPITFAEEVMGGLAHHPAFFADRPQSYEETVLSVRKFLQTITALRNAGKIPDDTTALIVVDSLRKLVPKGMLDTIMEEASAAPQKVGQRNAKGGKGVDGMGGRGAQMKAALNAAWLDELVPLLESAQAAFIAIARETEDPDADVWDKRAGRDYKIGGGKAIFYDASLAMRVERDRYVLEGAKDGDEGAKRAVYGERHLVTIHKTKVTGHEDRVDRAYFHTSNGVLVPAGFDRARDLVELGLELGVVRKLGSGGWLQYARSRWQGEHSAVKKLHADASLLEDLERDVRLRFEERADCDADGVVTA